MRNGFLNVQEIPWHMPLDFPLLSFSGRAINKGLIPCPNGCKVGKFLSASRRKNELTKVYYCDSCLEQFSIKETYYYEAA